MSASRRRSATPSSPGSLAALILAAGRSRRFGGAKLLAELRGRPLLSYVLDVAKAGRASGLLDDALIVIAAEDSGVAALARSARVRWVINPEPDLGLSTSLRCGLGALPADTGAALVLLGDQPMIRLDVVARLADAWRAHEGGILRPRYAGAPEIPGHPVLLDRAVWSLADRLEGDAGLGPVLASEAAEVTTVDVPGTNPDVDTPADLHLLNGPAS
ncbi:MAG: NTP transferase domain-containing protein [Gemmatimonadales bacterium]